MLMLCLFYLIMLIITTINNIKAQVRLIRQNREFINQINDINLLFQNIFYNNYNSNIIFSKTS